MRSFVFRAMLEWVNIWRRPPAKIDGRCSILATHLAAATVSSIIAILALGCARAEHSSQQFGFAAPQIPLNGPALAPVAHIRHCLQYPSECRARPQFRREFAALTTKLWADLVLVNVDVNRSIVRKLAAAGVLAEQWLIAPPAGDCHDFAVTKRHDLIERGWPSRAMLLAEVVMQGGEHHLVLVVQTDRGEFVMDSSTDEIVPWYQANYSWIRIQDPRNPHFWSAIGPKGA